MTALAGKPLRLPAKRIVGVAIEDEGIGQPAIVHVAEDYSWAGRLVRKPDGSEPIFWNLEQAANLSNVSPELYRSLGLAAVDPDVTGATVRAPKAIVYPGGLILDDLLVAGPHASITSAIAAHAEALLQKGVFCGGLPQWPDPVSGFIASHLNGEAFAPALPATHHTLAQDVIEGGIQAQTIPDYGEYVPLAGKTLYVSVSSFVDAGPFIVVSLGTVFTKSNIHAAAIDAFRVAAERGEQRWLYLVSLAGDGAGEARSLLASMSAAVPQCVVIEAEAGAWQAALEEQIVNFFGL